MSLILRYIVVNSILSSEIKLNLLWIYSLRLIPDIKHVLVGFFFCPGVIVLIDPFNGP